MLHWALVFFVVALIAAVFGFGGIAGEAAWIGKVLLVVFLFLALISMIAGRNTTAVDSPGCRPVGERNEHARAGVWASPDPDGRRGRSGMRPGGRRAAPQ